MPFLQFGQVLEAYHDLGEVITALFSQTNVDHLFNSEPTQVVHVFVLVLSDEFPHRVSDLFVLSYTPPQPIKMKSKLSLMSKYFISGVEMITLAL